MKLSQLTAQPKLIEVAIDDEDTIKEFGEPLVFNTWDRQPMEVFMRLANISEGNQSASIIEIVKTLILDENGKEILNNKNMLPTHVLMKAITKVTELLGK